MIHSNVDNATILERIAAEYPGIHQALDARRRILADAEWFHTSCEKHEEPIRKWEIRVREKSPRGRRWKSSMTDGRKLLSEASNLYLTVLGSEQEALRHLQSAVEQLRDLIGRSDIEMSPRVPEMLEQVARLREQEIRWIEEIVKLSSRIESLNGEATPDQVRSLLELRRRYLDQISMLKQTSRSLEERAFASSGPAPQDTNGDPDAAAEPASEPGASVEEIIDVEFEDLDKKLKDFTDERDQALARLAEIEAKFEAETEQREDLEKRVAKLTSDQEENLHRLAELAESQRLETARREGLEKELETVTGERDATKKTLTDALVAHAAEAEKWVEHEKTIGRIEAEKAEAARQIADTETLLAKEIEHRTSVEKKVKDLESERDDIMKLLAEAESRHVMDQVAWDEEKTGLMRQIEQAQCSRDETEARRLDELRRLREAVRALTGRVDEEIRGFEGEGG
jgi:chromosome segregation ATPase